MSYVDLVAQWERDASSAYSLSSVTSPLWGGALGGVGVRLNEFMGGTHSRRPDDAEAEGADQ